MSSSSDEWLFSWGKTAIKQIGLALFAFEVSQAEYTHWSAGHYLAELPLLKDNGPIDVLQIVIVVSDYPCRAPKAMF